MKQNHKKNDSAKGDIANLAAVVFVIVIFALSYLFVVYPSMRGPAADMEVNAEIGPTGDLSQYKVTLQFVDDLSYSQFLSELKTKNISSVNDYEFRTFSTSQFFTLKNDSSSREIIIEAKVPFDPNNNTMNIRVKKTPDFWEYEDKSVIDSSHISEKYINKLTYTLTTPSKVIYANILDNSSIFLSDGIKLTWHIDRDKNPLNPTGNNIASPTIYAKFEVPEENLFPKILIVIGVGIIIL